MNQRLKQLLPEPMTIMMDALSIRCLPLKYIKSMRPIHMTTITSAQATDEFSISILCQLSGCRKIEYWFLMILMLR
jgi:hypothetical protein